MNLHVQGLDLPLKHRFTIAHQSREVQETLIVRLEEDGLFGLGESTTNPFYGITLDNMREALEKFKPVLLGGKWNTPAELWELGKEVFRDNPFAQCALDQAAWDLYTKKKGKKLYEYLDLNPQRIPTTNFTIGIDTVEKMCAKLREVEWPIYKIKLGTDQDLEIVRELRKNTNSIFRVDANCAWTVDQAISYSEELALLGVEFIEQPLAKDNLEGMREVFAHSKLPLIRCGKMPGPFPWGKHQVGQSWRHHPCTPHDPKSQSPRHENHGGLHDRILRWHQLHCTYCPAFGLCGHGWGHAPRQRSCQGGTHFSR
jgi:L-alanine-DL-glutamate epimerase-like enolase superfamily enzyme